MTLDFQAAVERLKGRGRYVGYVDDARARADYLADLALLIDAADAGKNSSHDHGNCVICEHLDVYWRKQLAAALARGGTGVVAP